MQRQDVVLIDVTPLSLGIETMGGKMEVLIRRNTPYPTRKSREFTTQIQNQEVVRFPVYQGERPLTKDNHFLGEFLLKGIRKAPVGQPRLDVSFEVNANGILEVSARDKSSGASSKITISNEKSRLTEE